MRRILALANAAGFAVFLGVAADFWVRPEFWMRPVGEAILWAAIDASFVAMLAATTLHLSSPNHEGN